MRGDCLHGAWFGRHLPLVPRRRAPRSIQKIRADYWLKVKTGVSRSGRADNSDPFFFALAQSARSCQYLPLERLLFSSEERQVVAAELLVVTTVPSSSKSYGTFVLRRTEAVPKRCPFLYQRAGSPDPDLALGQEAAVDVLIG